MATLISNITEQGRTNMDSRTNVDLQGEPFKTFKFKTDTITTQHQATIVYTRSVSGDYLIWGNDTYGIWNSFKWGSSLTSEIITVRIVPPNGIFEENFLSDYFVETSETTATISGGYITF